MPLLLISYVKISTCTHTAHLIGYSCNALAFLYIDRIVHNSSHEQRGQVSMAYLKRHFVPTDICMLDVGICFTRSLLLTDQCFAELVESVMFGIHLEYRERLEMLMHRSVLRRRIADSDATRHR